MTSKNNKITFLGRGLLRDDLLYILEELPPYLKTFQFISFTPETDILWIFLQFLFFSNFDQISRIFFNDRIFWTNIIFYGTGKKKTFWTTIFVRFFSRHLDKNWQKSRTPNHPPQNPGFGRWFKFLEGDNFSSVSNGM